jgi:hypothetical protein
MFLIFLLWILFYYPCVFVLFRYKSIQNIILGLKQAKSVFIILSTIIVLNAFVIFYISHEKYIYFWDSAGYWDILLNSIKFVSNSTFNETLINLINSINNNDYNVFAAYLLVPTAKFLGITRLDYILSILNLFLIPAVFFISIIIKQILIDFFKLESIKFEYVFFLTAIFPPILFPMLRGYLDVLGLIPVSCLILILMNEEFKRINILKQLTIAVAILIILFSRRWYAFFVVSFLFSFGVVFLIEILKDSNRWLWLQKAIFNWLITFSFIFLILFCFFKGFLLKSAGVDYSYFYSAYKHGGFLSNIIALINYFGLFLILICTVSLKKIFNLKITIVLFLQLIIAYYLFFSVQSFGAQHYYILTVAILVLFFIGFNFLLTQVKSSSSLIFIFIVVAWILQSYNTFIMPVKYSHLFIKYPEYPLYRNDIGDIKHLSHAIANLDGSIYVLASSAELNDDILRKVNMPESDNAVSNMLPTSHIDLASGFPFQLFDAKYILVASPMDLHAGQKNQQDVYFFANYIMHGISFGKNYTKINTFKIGKQIVVNLYQKTKCFTETDLLTISDYFRDYYKNDDRFNNLYPLIKKYKCLN